MEIKHRKVIVAKLSKEYKKSRRIKKKLLLDELIRLTNYLKGKEENLGLKVEGQNLAHFLRIKSQFIHGLTGIIPNLGF